MPENLLAPSRIKLYGRLVAGLTIDPGTAAPAQGGNDLLGSRLRADDARLARIYGFSFEGHYYDLPKPAIFLVHGEGKEVTDPPMITQSGVAARDCEFAPDVRYWDYDQGDFSIRLDVESGPFEQILLGAALRDEAQLSSYSGASMRVSGASMRISGASMRISGASLRFRRNRGGDMSD